MKISTRIIHFILFICLVGHFSLQAHEGPGPHNHGPADSVKVQTTVVSTDTAIRIGPFKTDTLDKFIQAYGKDSLLRWIDSSIQKTVRSINNSPGYLQYNTTAELLLLDEHFKLGIDSNSLALPKVRNAILKLYGIKKGVTLEAQQMVDEIQKQNMDIYPHLVQTISKRDTRMGIALFGDKIPVSDKLLDTLFNYTAYNMTIPEKMEMYWTFAEFDMSVTGKNAKAKMYKSMMFDSLYKYHSISHLLSRLHDNKTNPLYHKFSNALRLVAYGFYGHDLTLKENGTELFYLLHMMHPDGGWREYFTGGSNVDILTSVYGLWSLAEMRSQLKAYDPQKN